MNRCIFIYKQLCTLFYIVFHLNVQHQNIPIKQSNNKQKKKKEFLIKSDKIIELKPNNEKKKKKTKNVVQEQENRNFIYLKCLVIKV